jgi:protein-tyrosine-phosphatase
MISFEHWVLSSAARARTELPGDLSERSTGDTGGVVPHGAPGEAFQMLIVCTGNICRSALAERLAWAYLDEALGADASAIQVRSAGTQAVVGSAVHPDSALVLTGLGGDPVGFAARQLVDDMASDADLTLTMTRTHRRVVLNAAPRALSRTFTLREASDLVRLVGAEQPDGDTFADRCRALVKTMAAARSKRAADAADDIADPIGQPVEFHEQVGEEIAGALLPVLGRLVSLREAAGRSALSVAGSESQPAQ